LDGPNTATLAVELPLLLVLLLLSVKHAHLSMCDAVLIDLVGLLGSVRKYLLLNDVWVVVFVVHEVSDNKSFY
jgi:hypothetical protein